MTVETSTTREVLPGGDEDVCPLCGIFRKFAGWTKLTCGEHFREPGCFVLRVHVSKEHPEP